jgi:glycosyltransferase involved in cell wall biosynthesis
MRNHTHRVNADALNTPPAAVRGREFRVIPMGPAVNRSMFKRVAVVHDWLPVYAGAEKVLEQILQVYPQADLYSMVDLLPDEQRKFLHGKPVHTSFLQQWKWVRHRYRTFLPVMPVAVEQFDLSGYELVISSSYAVAKGVITGPDQMHVCYCHSPMRYAWDLQHQYLRESHMAGGLRSIAARLMLHYLRIWDVQTANRVDHFIANSGYVRQRIRKIYGREAEIIHPPVDIERFALSESKGDYYVTAARLVPYKMVGTIVEAFNRMPDRELRVIGDGPQFQEIQRLAGPNVKMMGYQPDDVLLSQLQGAAAFINAALEDFGILPVEAQACGTPVIAFGNGGLRETVIDGQTGVFFAEQTADAIMNAVDEFEQCKASFSPCRIRLHAEKFSAARFREAFQREVETRWRAESAEPNADTEMPIVPDNLPEQDLVNSRGIGYAVSK